MGEFYRWRALRVAQAGAQRSAVIATTSSPIGFTDQANRRIS
jgi:hypothetical protein